MSPVRQDLAVERRLTPFMLADGAHSEAMRVEQTHYPLVANSFVYQLVIREPRERML
jgi:hypothetical protein